MIDVSVAPLEPRPAEDPDHGDSAGADPADADPAGADPADADPASPGLEHQARGAAPTRTPPVIRLGLLWAFLLAVAIALSPVLAALFLAPVAAVAALSAWRRMDVPEVEPWWLAAACAGAAPLAALGGPIPAVVAVVMGAAALVAHSARQAPPATQLRVALCAAAPAVAASSLVVADRQSATIGLVLLAAVTIFDASNYLMGVGETGGRLGALAAMMSLAVLAVLLAGALVVPFSGASPWLLCGMVALSAPLSVAGGHRLVGAVRLPAWRRLDSLFIAGPLWVVITATLLAP